MIILERIIGLVKEQGASRRTTCRCDFWRTEPREKYLRIALERGGFISVAAAAAFSETSVR